MKLPKSFIWFSCGILTDVVLTSALREITLPLVTYKSECSPTGHGAVSTDCERMRSYYTRVVVDGHAHNLVVDTGSGNLLLPNISCTVAPCAAPHHDAPKAAHMFCVGENATDIGVHASCVPLTLHMMSDNSAELSGQLPFDGVLGLGMERISSDPKSNVLSALFHQDTSTVDDSSSRFALLLGHPAYGPHMQSEITFGGYSNSRYSGRMLWTSVFDSAARGFWQLGLRNVLLGKDGQWPAKPIAHAHPCPAQPSPSNSSRACAAMVDSGTSVLTGPRDFIEALTRALQVEPDCKNYDGLPAIFLEVNGEGGPGVPPVYLQITRFEYVRRSQDSDGPKCSPLLQSFHTPVISSRALSTPCWSLGQPLLHRYYTVFDSAGQRIGFGLQKQPSMTGCHDDEVEMSAWNLPSCSSFKDAGGCHRHKHVATKTCRASCGLCSSPAPRAVV